jgi:hypothetical protein
MALVSAGAKEGVEELVRALAVLAVEAWQGKGEGGVRLMMRWRDGRE